MHRTILKSGFWLTRLEVNARQAIFHQWEQLEESGCIENFRIAAGLSAGFRSGWFFADSDAYKWLEAASRILAYDPNPKLVELSDNFIHILSRAQMQDGYLFTYNQIHFPNMRWQNLQIEHELYCHGHLIEAGVTHHEVTSRSDLLDIGIRAADRIVQDFRGKGAEYTPGHEEIEIALMRLHQVAPGDGSYLELARQFIEQRGRNPFFGISLFQQESRVNQRGRYVKQLKQEYMDQHPEFLPFKLPPGNVSKKPSNATLRWYASALTGKYFQQHAPVRKQNIPVGHSVRYAYLATATAMLARLSGDHSFYPALERAWERMVTRRMYVTGGIGSLPGLEGFGNDYELDAEFAYAETCAALASLFWNWEMAQYSSEAKYSDLFEWQLYNAAAVGMGTDGTTYLYNNPLECHGNVLRRPWYAVPCCPSNLSRTWADIGKYIFSSRENTIKVHQYISSQLRGENISFDGKGNQLQVDIDLVSDLSWSGNTRIRINNVIHSKHETASEFSLKLRQPGWTSRMEVELNGEKIVAAAGQETAAHATASGFDPRLAIFHEIKRVWQPGDTVEIKFEMPVRLRRAHPRVKNHQGKVCVTRGPLVYCLESVDHPDLEIFSARLDPDSLVPVFDEDLLGGVVKIIGTTIQGEELTFIPYFLWGNRGPSKMKVWVDT